MLQQTQVRTAIPYFESFLERFPTVEALAALPVERVLAAWSGLGYYRRARQLHQAAREIVSRGGFPHTARELEELPGIGAYTAAAVASIAFDEGVPALDGNVERVLSRYLALAGDPKRRPQRAALLAAGAALLDPEHPGEGNQSLMELGATVCVPRRPRCGECPLAESCRGRAAGDPGRYPPPRRRRPSERIVWSVAVVERNGKVLFFQRPETSGFLPGTWELPNVSRQGALEGLEQALADAYGGRWRLEEASFKVRHAVTYRSLTLRVHRARYAARSSAAGPPAAWIDPEERAEYGLSSMFEKVLARRSDLGDS
jgi:A/G-specific adenine glycosylase